MENARILDEKLRRIIKEISADTGVEIKKSLAQELTSQGQKNRAEEIIWLLQCVSKAIKKM